MVIFHDMKNASGAIHWLLELSHPLGKAMSGLVHPDITDGADIFTLVGLNKKPQRLMGLQKGASFSRYHSDLTKNT